MYKPKLRAWDKNRGEKGVMLENHTLITIAETGLGDNEDLIWMFSTGKQDINKKDLYDGDIVEFVAIVDEFKGYKDAAIGVIMWDHDDAGFFIENENDKFPHVKFWYAEEIKKVGNIYENPNLIKEWKER